MTVIKERSVVEVGRFLLRAGFIITNGAGGAVACEDQLRECPFIRILDQRTEIRRGFFGPRLGKEGRVIAELRLRCLDTSENLWRLHIYGQNNEERFTQLAEEISKQFHVDVSVRLVSAHLGDPEFQQCGWN
jgi:hypothetical protein